MSQQNSRVLELINFLYGRDTGPTVYRRLQALIDKYRAEIPSTKAAAHLTEEDSVLITYGDMVRQEGQVPLRTLAEFLQARAKGVVDTVHILPFFPYSSDDGFSVIDYKAVDPALGDWDDVARLEAHFRLMFDAVINHISRESDWFQAFLRDDPRYRHYFVTVEPGTDLSEVFRPRALPLLTPVQTAAGEKWVWTTFSDDQVDLNYHNPEVLLDVIDVLLFYVAHGAEFIRLDAIAFMWKEIGTSCIHLPKTHAIIQVLRATLDRLAPQVVLITETNVPHEENVSYFGNGTNEAQMVYNFSLPPLVLHAFHTGSAATLSRWAGTLRTPSRQTTFFNFLASHDGIGVTPAKGILSDAEIATMAGRVRELGGFVSYRNNPDGSQSVYELNINYLDALGNPAAANDDAAFVARRFLASQAIMLALRGVPGIYFHSLFGSRSWPEGVRQTGRHRTINRQKLQRTTLQRELDTPGSLRHHVFHGYRRLLQRRAGSAAFHPQGGQEVLAENEALFALLRTAPNGTDAVLCLHNVSDREQHAAFSLAGLVPDRRGHARDLLTDSRVPLDTGSSIEVTLAPYEVLWLVLPMRT